MDKKTLIVNLNTVFCALSKGGKKYSEVWLTEVDFGGLYMSNKYTLNIKADHEIDNCSDEIKEIVFLLYDKAKKEYEYIFEVIVYDSRNDIHCQTTDLIVYESDKACP